MCAAASSTAFLAVSYSTSFTSSYTPSDTTSAIETSTFYTATVSTASSLNTTLSEAA